LRKWIAALDQAIASDDRGTIKAVLKDAVPEFGTSVPAEISAPSGTLLQS
jgi:O-antigen biosynthesis protein WbqV